MTDAVLNELRAWLGGAPALQDVERLWVDYAPAAGPQAGLWPAGVQVLGRQSNVLGQTALHCRCRFTLRLLLPFVPGDDALAAANAQRLLALRRWVAEQSAAHTAPVFGDDPAAETLRAENARLERVDGEGLGCYRLELTAEFREKYDS